MSKKTPPSSAGELESFVSEAGDRLLVVDLRNPDASVEPEDQESLALGPLPSDTIRPCAVNLVWDRASESMPLPTVSSKDTPIITHCGGGTRGQQAKEFLIANGFTNVLNGGGPWKKDLWAVFGDK
jgi:rhodanese-related sulfurtransferase